MGTIYTLDQEVDLAAGSIVAADDFLIYDESVKQIKRTGADAIAQFVLGSGTLAATVAEINRVADVSTRMVAGGSTLTLTELLHDGKTVLFDQADGTVLTLPPATGTGMRIRCLVGVTATSVSHIVVCAGSDELLGTFLQTQISDDSVLQYEAATGDSFVKVSWNRTTTGLAIIGDWVEFQDVATALWAVHGAGRASGSVATPFST